MPRTAAPRSLAALLLTVLLAPAVPAAADEPAPVSRDTSAVDFTLKAKALITVSRDGRFRQFEGAVAYDPERPAATRLDVTVYTDSVDMKNADHDALLRSEGYFDAAHYPTMRFVSHSATPRADGLLDVEGDLTIRGVTRRLVIAVAVRHVAGQPVLDTSFSIDRTEFGLNGPAAKPKGFNVSIGRDVRIHMAMAPVAGLARR